jgi:hypothetical protein
MTNRWMIVVLAACSAPARKEPPSPPPQGAYVEYEVTGEVPPPPSSSSSGATPVTRDQPANVKLKLGHYHNAKLGIGVTVDLTEETESVADIDPAKLRFDGETKVWHLTGRYGGAGSIEYVRDRGGVMLEITRDRHVSVRIPDDEAERWSEVIEVTRDGDADPL